MDGAQFGSLVRLDISEGSLGTLRGDRVLVDEGTADRNRAGGPARGSP